MNFFRPGSFFKSLDYAVKGLKYTYTHEQNFRVHTFAAAAVILLALLFQVELREAVILILVVASVLVLEIVNTVFEKITDLVKPRLNHYVEVIKDLMAAAVLISSVAALLVGILIFFPYVRAILE